MSDPELAEFRARLRDWLEESLPHRWRDILPGEPDDALYIEARLGFGRALSAGGWAAPTWPKAYGGMGLSIAEFEVYLEEVVAVGAPEPLNMNAIGILGPTLLRFGTEGQRLDHLPKMLSHEVIWCQGFSEPEAGSDLASLRTRAVPEGDGWRVSGQKIWSTLAQHAQWCYLLARTDQASVRHAGLSLLLLNMDQSGVTVRPIKTIAGNAEFNEIFLDEARVEPEGLVGEAGDGWQLAAYALAHERATNFTQRALRVTRDVELMRDDLRQRCQRGERTQVTDELVDAVVATRTVDAMIRTILDCLRRDEPLDLQASIAKLAWSEAHQSLLLGFLASIGPEAVIGTRYEKWRQAALYSRAETIYAGTSEIQRNIIARAMHLPRSGGNR